MSAEGGQEYVRSSMNPSDRLALIALTAAVIGSGAWYAGERPVSGRTGYDAALPMPDLGGSDVPIPDALELRITYDGSLPVATSDRVIARSSLFNGPRIERLLYTPTSVQWRRPNGVFPTAAIVRARFIDEQGRLGPVATRTMLEPGAVHELPVISIVLPEGALFDPDSGIYVVGHGVFRDEEPAVRRYPHDQRWWKYPGNYQFRGGAWERDANVEYIDGGTHWSSPVKLRINGNNTRGFPQHALRLVFGKGSEGRRRLGCASMVLRNGGNDQDRAFLRDAVQHRLCAGLPFTTSAYTPCVVYVNGAYWGLHDLRERLDAEGIAAANKVKVKRIAVLEDRTLIDRADSADVFDFKRMVVKAEHWDPGAPWYTDSLALRLDVDGFLRYMAAQIILGNSDWPDQNVKYWRWTGEADSSGMKDGRWRFVMGDSDMGLGFNGGAEVDLFAHVAGRRGPVARLFQAGMRNTGLRQRFRAITLDLLDGQLSAMRMEAVINAARAAIAAEMPRHIRRWRRPLTLDRWNAEVAALLTFARDRGAVVRRQLDQHLPERP